MSLAAEEKQKYQEIWKNPDYRSYSPGELMIWAFMRAMVPLPGSRIIDFGTGTGRVALWFHRFNRHKRVVKYRDMRKADGKEISVIIPAWPEKMCFDVTMVDISDNCLDEEVRKEIGDKLVIANLWETPIPVKPAEYGFCADVMEHIPPEHVDDVISNIMDCCEQAFFLVCTKEDHFGQTIGKHLHLTVQPFSWWKDKMADHGMVIGAIDMLNSCAFHLKR